MEYRFTAVEYVTLCVRQPVNVRYPKFQISYFLLHTLQTIAHIKKQVFHSVVRTKKNWKPKFDIQVNQCIQTAWFLIKKNN